MCYRCDVCLDVVPHNTPRMVHIIKYPRGHLLAGNIMREAKVCSPCRERLTGVKCVIHNNPEAPPVPETLTRMMKEARPVEVARAETAAKAKGLPKGRSAGQTGRNVAYPPGRGSKNGRDTK